MTARFAVDRGERIAGHLLNDRWVRRLARAGIVSRAVNYLVLAILVTLVLFGRGDHEVDRRGAIETIGAAPLGRCILVLLCVGFAAYVAWQLVRAASHRGGEGRASGLGRRLLALGTAAIYLVFLLSAATVALGSSTSSPQSSQQSLTAQLLADSGGRMVVVATGIVVIGVGAVLVGVAAARRFEAPLDTSSMGAAMRRTTVVLGVAGQVGRGLVFALIGGFVVSAGVSRDASRSKGLDASLHSLAGTRVGAISLSVVAVGFVAFGLYSLVDARYRDDFSR